MQKFDFVVAVLLRSFTRIAIRTNFLLSRWRGPNFEAQGYIGKGDTKAGKGDTKALFQFTLFL